MAYHPPKGMRPPQLEGKRTGRPKGSMNLAPVWRDVLWAYDHRFEKEVWPPSGAAGVWWWLAIRYPDELEEFLEAYGQL